MKKYDNKSNEEIIKEVRELIDELESRLIKKENNIEEVKTNKTNSCEEDDIISLIDKMYDEIDPLYNEVVAFLKEKGCISPSMIQRKFKLGYNRAARLIDKLEEDKLIGPWSGSKPREYIGK